MGILGTRIRQRRKELGLTLKEVGKAAGVSASAIAELEQGRSKGSTKLHKIATALDTTPEALTGEESVKPAAKRPYALDADLLADCLAGLDEGLGGRHLSPEKRAGIVCALYENWAEQEVKPTRAQVISFVRRVA